MANMIKMRGVNDEKEIDIYHSIDIALGCVWAFPERPSVSMVGRKGQEWQKNTMFFNTV